MVSMAEVIVDRDDYKLFFAKKPIPNSNLRELTILRQLFRDGKMVKSSSEQHFLEQEQLDLIKTIL